MRSHFIKAVLLCGSALTTVPAIAQEGSAQAPAVAPAPMSDLASKPSQQASAGQTAVSNPSGPAMSPAPGSSGSTTQAASDTVSDIIVTAQKRSESVQKVPIAITAVSGESLRQSSVSTVNVLTQSVPSLLIGQTFGEGNLALRGISLNAVNFATEGSIALNIDGVYVQRTAAALSNFFDLQRVEVLRGPQGTLYGRNATGGAINLVSADPTTNTSGYLQATGGIHGHAAVEGAISGPVTSDETLLYRAAIHFDRHSGYGTNLATGNDVDSSNSKSARLKLLWHPSEPFKLLLIGDYTHEYGLVGSHFAGTINGTLPYGTLLPRPDGTSVFLGGQTASNVRDTDTDSDLHHRATYWGVTANASYDLGGVTLRSITAYRESKTYTEAEIDGTSYPLFGPGNVLDDGKQVSQEFQLAGKVSKLDYTAGLYYFHEKDPGHVYFPLNSVILNAFGVPVPPSNPPQSGLRQGYATQGFIKTDAYAAFGQVTEHFSDKLSLTVGGRYSIERKGELGLGLTDLATPYTPAGGLIGLTPNDPRIAAGGGNQCGEGIPTIGFTAANGPCVPHKTFRAFTPKVGVEFTPIAPLLLYASFSRGFKSGTYNVGVAQPPVNPEKVTDYEAGIKATWLGGKLRTNFAGFYYDYKDLQVNLTRTFGTSASQVLQNAAAAHIYGLEAEIVAKPVPQIQLDLNSSYLHATFSQYVTQDDARKAGDGHTLDAQGNPAFNLKGNDLPQSPRFSGRAGASFLQPLAGGTLTLRGEIVFSSKLYFTPFNTASAEVRARQRYNASVNWTSGNGRWSLGVVARNLANKVRVTNGLQSTSLVGSPIAGYLEDPRTVDFIVNLKF